MSGHFTKPTRISLKSHPTYSENWVQDIIADDPSIIGLGDLVLRDRERPQPRAGRLDLLLQHPDTYKRYEVELQLGATDEAHIIRCIEYWDIERKRYPQYEHCAVLIAEDITSRFLNVVSLFNGTMPIIAIQMQALEIGDHHTLVFTKVIDEFERGLIDEDEDAISFSADRSYWESTKGTPETMAWADRFFGWVREIDPEVEPKYNKGYIGLLKGGRAWNYVTLKPIKKFLIFEPKIPQSPELDERLEESGLDILSYNSRWKLYVIRLTQRDLAENEVLLRELITQAKAHRDA